MRLDQVQVTTQSRQSNSRSPKEASKVNSAIKAPYINMLTKQSSQVNSKTTADSTLIKQDSFLKNHFVNQ